MADDPLAGLFQSIQDATIIQPPVDYRPDITDPFFRLIKTNEKQLKTNEKKQVVPASSVAPQATSLGKSKLSERTRQAILNRPLQGQSRLEAVDLALHALDNPSKAQIENILEILISG